MQPVPPLDAFGTRLDPAALRSALASFGLPAAHLRLDDHGVTLTIAGADPNGDDASRAATWLRGAFSPLVPFALRVDPSLPPGPPVFDDRREQLPDLVALAEVFSPPAGLPAALHDLLDRLHLHGPARPAQPAACPAVDDPELAARLRPLAEAWGEALASRGHVGGTLSWASYGAKGPQLHRAAGPGPHLLAWQRPGGAHGVRPALILAASERPAALAWLLAALDDPTDALPPTPVLLDGLTWAAARRPTIAHPAPPGTTSPILVDEDRCTSCGLCAQLCPTDFLTPNGAPVDPSDPSGCIRCYDCVDACPEDALRPTHAPDTATRSELPLIRDGWLARLRGGAGPLEPAPFPPSFLLPSPRPVRVVLGLAVISQQEHAAALIIDGELVGAVEEEKLARVRHFGWKPRPGHGFRNLGLDPTLMVEQVFARRSIRVLLAEHGLTLDDVDLIALNGLLSRYRQLLPVLDPTAPIPTLRAGRLVCVPHHLSHAASAYRFSGLDRAWVLTVDGRGDRETAGLFRAEGDQITPVHTALSLTDRSIGGVYETITRLLGFGSHGQGSLMALAAFGTPSEAVRPFLSAQDWDHLDVHESGLEQAFAADRRAPDAPIERRHQDLAASLQHALEQTLLQLVHTGTQGALDNLCLAGGVTLNCRANNLLRTTLEPKHLWAQPGANDGGTAIGAAAEAWARYNGSPLQPMQHAAIGPAFDDDAIEAALRRAGVAYTRSDDVAADTAHLLAEGQVVCWFQGRLEFGPRALGSRSILADPRRTDMQDKVNRIKTREGWRPFGPSILAGHEAAWFERAFDSRFMLFTIPVLTERRHEVPAIVHVDGTSRPQVVHAETHPRYHALISAFYDRTGVPMLMNTSFNRRGEPIVGSPADALDAFPELGADVLAIGSFLVRRGELSEPAPMVKRSDDELLAALPGGRRLSLRLTTSCDHTCVHCTLRDHFSHGEASQEQALRSLAEGRRAGCDELVIMRGEATLRDDAPRLISRARRMGYRYVQVQTHGATLADPRWLGKLREAGVDAFEVQLLAPDAPLHDRLAGKDGAFRATVAGLQHALRSGATVWVTAPVLRRNALHLPRLAALVAKLGLSRLQLQFPRPVELADGVPTDELLSLSRAAAAVERVTAYALKLGLTVSTEGFPLCLLPTALHGTPDAAEDFTRHRVDDLGVVHDEFHSVRQRMRPDMAPCAPCALRARCPRTWSGYLELVGSGELRTQAGGSPPA